MSAGLLLDGSPAPSLPVVILGTGDYARTAAQLMREESGVDVVAFTVHDRFLADDNDVVGLPVVAFESLHETHPPDTHLMLVAVGYSGLNERRAEACREAEGRGYCLVSYVSPSATVSSSATIGSNSFVFEQNVVQPFVTIGDNVVVWSANHIGHDSTIGDHCFIASHVVISGRVTIGDHCFLGVNATIGDGVTIGAQNIVGAGALVLRDSSEGDVFAARHTDKHAKKSWELNF